MYKLNGDFVHVCNSSLGSSSRAKAQEQNKFLKHSFINIYSFIDKLVVCVVVTGAVIGCLSVNDANLLTSFPSK